MAKYYIAGIAKVWYWIGFRQSIISVMQNLKSNKKPHPSYRLGT
jgi:hypothetical protein